MDEQFYDSSNSYENPSQEIPVYTPPTPKKREKNNRLGFRICALALVFALLGGALGAGGVMWYESSRPSRTRWSGRSAPTRSARWSWSV